ncbi:MAG: HEPN domain-containing protein [Defluviitaleaceae bacterium]|nr:HEPN domain-containing protein [Defluviitaleaceae bacterium]
MAEVGTYLYIAQKDLRRAELMHGERDYCASGRFSEQAVEKAFKSFIEQKGKADDYKLMALHKPWRLYDRCNALGFPELTEEEERTLHKLPDYYYDTNYPGNAYFELTQAQSQEALDMARTVVGLVEEGLGVESKD